MLSQGFIAESKLDFNDNFVPSWRESATVFSVGVASECFNGDVSFSESFIYNYGNLALPLVAKFCD